MNKEISKEYLIREFVENERSTYDIAEECGTYANKIRRALKSFKIKLRDKSAAQSVAIRTGRHKHPTKGNKRSEDIRIKIGEGVAKAWESLNNTEKEKRILIAKQQWEEMSEEQKEHFKQLAANAVRKAAGTGSKLEKFLLIELKFNGYNVIFHKSNMVSKEDLQVDLYLPDLRVAIEVDGPTHFYPIWGKESLERHLVADHIKTGLLLADGYVLIRIKNLAKSVSKIKHRKLLTKLIDTLKSIEKDFPTPSNRLIEIEVT